MAGSGSGAERETCLNLARDLGDQVVYHGILSHQALADLMQQAHLFVLPSFFEGLPLVLMEALACGCRIISTDLPGVREIFSRQHPFMVRLVDLPPLKTVDQPHEKDMPELIRRLSNILEEVIHGVMKDHRPDEAFVQSAGGAFAWENIFLRVEKIYRELADTGK